MSEARAASARFSAAIAASLSQVVGAEKASELVSLAEDGPCGHMPNKPETPTQKAMRLLETASGRQRLAKARTWDEVLDV